MRLVRREILRDAVFLWRMPFWAPRISSGSAAFMAMTAASLLPETIASSTLRSVLRTRLVRFLLTGRGAPKRALPSLPILYWPLNFPDHFKRGQTARNNIKAISDVPIAQHSRPLRLGGLYRGRACPSIAQWTRVKATYLIWVTMASSTSTYLGIDLGTTALKCMITDHKQRVAGVAEVPWQSRGRGPAGPNRRRRTGGKPAKGLQDAARREPQGLGAHSGHRAFRANAWGGDAGWGGPGAASGHPVE